MGQKLVIFQNRGSFESSYQVASMAVVAAAMGTQVMIVLSFDALRAWVEKRWGAAISSQELETFQRGQQLGTISPIDMVSKARELGVRVVACETVFRLVCPENTVVEQLDELMGLPSIWQFAQEAKVLSF